MILIEIYTNNMYTANNRALADVNNQIDNYNHYIKNVSLTAIKFKSILPVIFD